VLVLAWPGRGAHVPVKAGPGRRGWCRRLFRDGMPAAKIQPKPPAAFGEALARRGWRAGAGGPGGATGGFWVASGGRGGQNF